MAAPTCILAPGSPDLISVHSLFCLICFSHTDLPAVPEHVLALTPGPLHMFFWTVFPDVLSSSPRSSLCPPLLHLPLQCTVPPDLPGSPVGLFAISLLCTSLRMMTSPCCVPQVPH